MIKNNRIIVLLIVVNAVALYAGEDDNVQMRPGEDSSSKISYQTMLPATNDGRMYKGAVGQDDMAMQAVAPVEPVKSVEAVLEANKAGNNADMKETVVLSIDDENAVDEDLGMPEEVEDEDMVYTSEGPMEDDLDEEDEELMVEEMPQYRTANRPRLVAPGSEPECSSCSAGSVRADKNEIEAMLPDEANVNYINAQD